MGVRVGEGDDDNDATGESGVMIVWFYGITHVGGGTRGANGK